MNTIEVSGESLPEEIRNQLLLYWSDELEKSNAEAVRAALPEHPEWQAYLDDLNSLSEQLGGDEVLVAAPPEAVEAAVSRVQFELDETEASGPVISLAWVKPLAAAAVIVFAGVLLHQRQARVDTVDSGQNVAAEEGAQPAVVESNSPEELSPPVGRSRSARLFASRNRAQTTRFDATRRQLQQLRTKIEKS